MRRILTITLLLLACILLDGNKLIAQISVYPGDVNNDGLVDVYDLPNLGTAFGDSGAARAIISSTWAPFPITTQWTDSMVSIGLNNVYADCNGNGFADTTDFDALLANYGLMHNIPTVVQPFSPLDPTGVTIFIDSFWFDIDTVGESLLFVNFAIGSTPGSITGVDGIAMKIKVDTTHLLLGPALPDATVNFTSSQLGVPAELMHLDDVQLLDEGGISVASARKSMSAVIFPPSTDIFTVGFVMEGNIAGGVGDIPHLHIAFEDVLVLNSDGMLMPIWAPGDSISLEPLVVPKDTGGVGINPNQRIPLKLYPQPASNYLVLEGNFNNNLPSSTQLTVYNALGQRQNISAHFGDNKIYCDTKHLTAGSYILKISTAEGVISKHFQIQKRRF